MKLFARISRRGAWNPWNVLWFVGVMGLGLLGIRFEGNPLNGFIEKLELSSYDARVRFQGGVPFRSDLIALVGIDDSTFGFLEADPVRKADSKWPFPNSFHAEVAQKLTDMGARSVMFDLLSFANPSREKYGEEDAAFASMALETKTLGIANKFSQVSGKSWGGGAAQGNLFETWTLPAKPFRKIPRGFVNVPVDADGVIRRYQPYYWRQMMFPENCLALEGLRLASFSDVKLDLCPKAVGSVPAPIYFPHVDPRSIASSVISYAEILLASPSQELTARVKGRLVFVGPLFTESHDFFFTPFTGKSAQDLLVPGVFFHAMVANAILQKLTVRRVPRPTEQAMGLVFMALALVISWLATPLWGFLLTFLLALGYGAFAFWVFRENLFWLPLASPYLAGLGAAIPNMALKLMVSEQKQLMIKNLFSSYVSSDVLAYVQTHPEILRMEGERREATVFFSDLKGFTTISETMPAEKLSQVMNDYLTPMTDIIMRRKGYLDKYIGDAIMAVFGVPMPDSRHAENACIAAIEQKRKLVQVAEQIEKIANVKISVRMGINTGPVCAGNMGSQNRFQYTVMGDTVNQASRFEGANKIFGSAIMIGEGTYEAAKSVIFARPLAHLTVKGKTRAVVVYELLDLQQDLPPEQGSRLGEFCRDFENAFSFFLKAELSQARAKFSEFLAQHPDDGPAQFYLEQCDELIKGGIPPKFNGEIKLDSK